VPDKTDVQVDTARTSAEAERARLAWAALIVAEGLAPRFGVSVGRAGPARFAILVGPHSRAVSPNATKRAASRLVRAAKAQQNGDGS
jgi:hypothetical protein